jgi:hypothetical protein
MSDDEADDDLIQFRPRADLAEQIEGPIVLRRKHWEDCKHWPVELDMELRAVSCTKCGERLDPISVLIEFWFHWERYAREFEQMREWDRQAKEKVAERSRKREERWEKQRAKREAAS